VIDSKVREALVAGLMIGVSDPGTARSMVDLLTARTTRSQRNIDRIARQQDAARRWEPTLRGAFASRVIAAAARYYLLDPEVITGRDQSNHAAEPRHVAIWVLHEYGYGPSEIGRSINRHHTTVLYVVEKLRLQMHHDPDLREAAKRVSDMSTPNPETKRLLDRAVLSTTYPQTYPQSFPRERGGYPLALEGNATRTRVDDDDVVIGVRRDVSTSGVRA
jgi:hypothetical protein